MFDSSTVHARSDTGRASAGRIAALVATLAGETRAAFEALARRQYDAPWQRVPPAGARRPH